MSLSIDHWANEQTAVRRDSDYVAIVGREAIQTTFSEILRSGVSKIELKTKDVFGEGDLLAEEGEVTVYANGTAVAEEKYIILWKNVDGKWKLFRDIANSNSK